MNTRAKWVEGVPDLYATGRLADVDSYLTVAAVSAKTGLAVNTIVDLLSRPPITAPTNTLASISRPKARIGNQPLYSADQVDEVIVRQRETGHRHLGGGSEPLPRVSPEEARKRDLISVAEIADLCTPPVHEQTVRRWARDREDFPRAVALRSREGGHPGVPLVVYPGKKVRAFLTFNHYIRIAS